MNTRVLRVMRALALLAALAGCRSPAPGIHGRAVDADTSVRGLLVESLRRSVRESDVPGTVEETLVQFTTQRSAAVPGLVYHWATYRQRAVSHGFAFAVAGARGGTVRLLESPADWAAAAGPFSVANGSGARDVCEEVIRTAGSGRDPRVPPHVWDSVPPPFAVGLDQPAARALAPPRITRPDPSSWAVDLWALEIRRARSYQCVLAPGAPQADRVRLMVRDSIHGVGFLPPG